MIFTQDRLAGLLLALCCGVSTPAPAQPAAPEPAAAEPAAAEPAAAEPAAPQLAAPESTSDERRDGILTTTLGELSYYILLAELAARRGELAAALDNYRVAARLSDDPRVAERATGMALYVKDDSATLDLAQRWYSLDPDSLRARQALALALLRGGQIEPALEHLEAARQAADDGQDGFATLTALLEQANDRDVAYQTLAKLRERAPESRYAHYYFALAAMRIDRPDDALTSLGRALEIDPRWREALLLSTQIRIRQDDAEAALNQLGQAVLAQPSDRELRLGYARLLVAGDQLELARAQFEMLAEQNPDDADSLYALGLLAAEAEQLDAAETYLRRVLDLGQRQDDVYFELGKLEEQRERYDEAVRWYEQVGEGERFLGAQVRAATAQARGGDLDAMSNRLAALRVNHPNDAVSLYVTEAEVLRDLGHHQSGFELLDKALRDYPDNSELLYARALAAERLDRLDILERDLRAIIADDPDNGHALNALGYTLADRTDRYREALELLERAIKLLPDDPAVLDSMGWVQYRLGNLEQALGYLRRAYELNDDPEIVSHLSEVLWQSGDREQAEQVWQKAFEEAPDSEHLLRLRERFDSGD